jgi:NAD(P)-dependent dehydrogenase (short-subunit alcohol dehydrogenase family)
VSQLVRLAGKVAVVTGAGRGIGSAIALAYAAEGASVALAARSEDALEGVAATIEQAGGRALPVVTDVRDPVEVARLARTVAGALGEVDVLVNNCGIAGPTAVLWEIDPLEWDATLRTNLTGTYLCCRAFLPEMVARGSGSVVVIGSGTGKRPLFGRTPYATTKLGLVGLVRTLAVEAGPHGVRVNLISPGAVEGERLDAIVDAQSRAKGITLAQARDEMRSVSPLGRLVGPEDVARAAVFLASDEAASITGEDLNVTAGAVMH